jgi:hypothetical protein
MALNVLLEATPLDNGAPTTIRMSSASSGSNGTNVGGLAWLPVLTQVPSPSFSISSGGGAISPMNISMGSVNFRIGKRWANLDWNTYSWVGAPVTMWVGETNKPFSTYRQFFTGTLSGLARTGNVAELALRTVEGQLDAPLLNKRYAGTGGSEGPVGLKGALKPYCIGDARFVTPVPVDPALLTYQVHGYGRVTGIATLYEYGQALGPSIGDATTYQAMADAKLKPGEWVSCNALGMFRLGGRPDKLLVADVLGAQHNGTTPTTLAAILPMLLQEAGVSPQRIGNMSALDFAWSFYTTDQITVADLVKQAALEAGAYVFPDRTGVWRCGRHRAAKPATEIRADRTSEPLLETINELNVADPTWRVQIGHSRCWTVHSQSDISPKLLELEGKLNARDEVLDALIGEAAQAAADAEFSRREMEAMLADGFLNRPDKPRAIAHLERERSRYDRLEGVYQAYKVKTQWDAYQAAWLAAEAYMLALTPSIYDDSADTPVNATEYLAIWATYNAAMKLLYDTIIGRTVGVPGGAPIGAVIGPDGTIIGGKPADELLDDVESGKNAWKQLPDLVGPLLQKPIDEISAVTIGFGAGLQKAQSALHKKNLVAIRSLETWVAEDGSKIAQDVLQLTSRVDQAELDLAGIDIDGSIEAGLKEVRETIANLDFAQASEIDTKIAKYDEGVTAWQTEESRVRAEKDSALAEDIEQLGIRITNEAGGNVTELEGQFNDFRRLFINEDGSIQAVRQDEMGVAIQSAVDGVTTAYQGAIKTVDDARIEDKRVTTERIENFESSIKVTDAAGNPTSINAALQTIRQAVADVDDGASSELVEQLQSRLDNFNGTQGASLEAAYNTYANKVDGVGSSVVFKVQTDINGVKYVAGMGVALENDISAVTFSADSLRFIVPGSPSEPIFYADANGLYADRLTVGKLRVNTAVVPVRATASSDIQGDNNYLVAAPQATKTVLSTTVYLPTFGTVECMYAAKQHFTKFTGSGWTMALFINGSEVTESLIYGSIPGDTPTGFGSRFLAAGYHTVELRWNGEYDMILRGRSLLVKGYPNTQ